MTQAEGRADGMSDGKAGGQDLRMNPDLLYRSWPAKWIACPGFRQDEYGVYLFRKSFDLTEQPREFLVHVSADNRHELFVNGVCVNRGPARGWLQKWNFCSLELSAFLKPGTNLIAARVWNFAEHRAVAQITAGTGFILQGDSAAGAMVNTGPGWLVTRDEAWQPLKVELPQYYIAGAGEEFRGEKHPWDWLDTDFDSSAWQPAVVVDDGKPIACRGEYGTQPIRLLSRQDIPFIEENPQRFLSIRRSSGSLATDGFVEGKTRLVIPPGTRISLLFDQAALTTAYPVLTFSRGKNGRIRLTYAESLVDDQGNKGQRGDIEGKRIIGNSDLIHPDGGSRRSYQTLYWRTFRYVEMEVTTEGEALVLEDFHSLFCAYPLPEKGWFRTGDALLDLIWKTGWHTQRLCANESFMDTPYYEQLQYIGDARIQALITTCVSGDLRLGQNAIAAAQASLLPGGLTQSRYPSSFIQVIPPFSLVWITLIHDYWMRGGDQKYVFSLIPDMLGVLGWFKSRLGPDGLPGPVDWWAFVDWVDFSGWDAGNPPGAHSGGSSILGLQFAYTLDKAAGIFGHAGFPDLQRHQLALARELKDTIFDRCFDPERYLVADTPERKNFSQHAGILALLAGAIPSGIDRVRVLETLLADKTIAQATLYFKYYLFEALEKTGQADRFLKELGPWKTMIETGLTTFAETPDPTRSDCHAWSASPVYFFLSLVAGIKPGSPGFASVRIEPHPGSLRQIDAAMPHPAGMISLKLRITENGRLAGEVSLPEGVPGVLAWQGQEKALLPGLNHLD